MSLTQLTERARVPRAQVFRAFQALLVPLAPLGVVREECTVRYSTGTIQYRYRTVQYIYMVPFRNRRTEVVPKSINFPGLY